VGWDCIPSWFRLLIGSFSLVFIGGEKNINKKNKKGKYPDTADDRWRPCEA